MLCVGAPLQAQGSQNLQRDTYKKLLPAEVGWKSGRRHGKPALWLRLRPRALQYQPAGRGVDQLPTIQARARGGTSRRQPSGGLHTEQHKREDAKSLQQQQQQHLWVAVLYFT